VRCVVTVSRPPPGGRLRGEDGEVLEFASVRAALGYLIARNYSLRDLAGLDFHIEKAGASGPRREKLYHF
jgi:hypothetical protein